MNILTFSSRINNNNLYRLTRKTHINCVYYIFKMYHHCILIQIIKLSLDFRWYFLHKMEAKIAILKLPLNIEDLSSIRLLTQGMMGSQNCFRQTITHSLRQVTEVRLSTLPYFLACKTHHNFKIE